MPREHYRGHTPRMSRLMAFIEPACAGHLSACGNAKADGSQGVVAHPCPQPAEGGPVAVLWATGHRRLIAASRIHPPAVW